MISKTCVLFGLVYFLGSSFLLSGCETAEQPLTTTMAPTPQPSTTVISNLNGNNVVFDNSTQSYFVALGTTGYARCGKGASNCMVTGVPSGLDRVDDIAVADGFIFLLDAVNPRLAVAQINGGAVAQLPIAVNGKPFTGVSAAGGRAVVSGGASLVQSFSYDSNGILSLEGTVDLGRRGGADVYQPNGDLAFASTDFSNFSFSGYGMAVLNLTDRSTLNTVLLQNNFPSSGGPANFALVSDSFQSQQGLCLVATSELAGLVVVCSPESSQSSQRFDIPQTTGAQSVAVGGSRAFVITLVNENLSLITVDLTPLNTGAIPVVLSSSSLASGVAAPVDVAAAADGSEAIVAANVNGLIISSASKQTTKVR